MQDSTWRRMRTRRKQRNAEWRGRVFNAEIFNQMNGRFALFVSSMLFMLPAALGDDGDPRELVALPAIMQQHMLSNMRDHLLAIAEIQKALADSEFDQAADIAENRIGMSSLASHGASHMAPYMPRRMRDIGAQMHGAASRFALVAQEAAVDRDPKRVLESLSVISHHCVACHAIYRIR